MVHIPALPGTPRSQLRVPQLRDVCLREADSLTSCGIRSLLLENMHDVPYLNRTVGPEIVATMAVIAAALKSRFDVPIGIQVLAGANREALAVALASGADFIRVEGFVFAHVADEGIFESDAGQLLRYRRAIGADDIRVFTDIKKKHSSHAITSDVDIVQTAEAAAFFGADGLVITGTATGRPVDVAELKAVRAASSIPVLVGSGITPQNLPTFWDHADGFIVGSSLKGDGQWDKPVDPDRVRAIVEAARRLHSR